MVKNRQKGITKAYRNDKKDVDSREVGVTIAPDIYIPTTYENTSPETEVDTT